MTLTPPVSTNTPPKKHTDIELVKGSYYDPAPTKASSNFQPSQPQIRQNATRDKHLPQ